MAAKFSSAQWKKIMDLFDRSGKKYGLPARRRKSVVIGTFNIRELGSVKNKSPESWKLLTEIIKRFDLIAIQEVLDDLSGFENLHKMLGKSYGVVVSDVTGVKPGATGNAERLGYMFNWRRIERTSLASDITYDRSEIVRNLYENRDKFSAAWVEHTKKLNAWKRKALEKKKQGKRAPSKPSIELPLFVSFIRQPHYVSFQIKSSKGKKPLEFLIVNAHLLYGVNKLEREWEFRALIAWLTIRAKQAERLYHPNLLLLGDCNLDFESDVTAMRDEIDKFIKGLNKSKLKSKKAATANFPMLSKHPKRGILRTALRQEQTYDQIGLFAHDKRLPTPKANEMAGSTPDGYDYGVFNIANLIANAIHGDDIDKLTNAQKKEIFKKAEFDISDHMPAWIRLPIPS